jgi:hypothetical protein
MKEIEKRLGMSAADADMLKERMNQQFMPVYRVGRTVLVKVEGDGFTPDPNVQVDIKIKLISSSSILSIKQGSWHGDTERSEYDVNFSRDDLANVVGGLSVFGYSRYVLLSTLRTTWREDNLQYTLDEYRNIGQSLFEIEATRAASEADVDLAFDALGIKPMDSAATIAFIAGINEHRSVQIDLETTSVADVVERMLKEHADVG